MAYPWRKRDEVKMMVLFVICFTSFIAHGDGATQCVMQRLYVFNAETHYKAMHETATLKCKLPYVDYPDNDLRWMKNGYQLIKGIGTDHDKNFTAKRDAYSGYYSLEIRDVSLDDVGRYECECYAKYDTTTGKLVGSIFWAWDTTNHAGFKVFVSEPMTASNRKFTYGLMVNGKRRKVGETLKFYPGAEVSISSNVTALDAYPGPNRKILWYWKDDWLAEMFEEFTVVTTKPKYIEKGTIYSYSYGTNVYITSSCEENKVGDHRLMLRDWSSVPDARLPQTEFEFLTVSCQATPFVLTPTDITALVAAVIHIIGIVLIAVNWTRHMAILRRGKGKRIKTNGKKPTQGIGSQKPEDDVTTPKPDGRKISKGASSEKPLKEPLPGTVLVIVVMEFIMVFCLIFVPIFQSIGRIGRAGVGTASYVAVIIMAIGGVLITGAVIGVEAHVLNNAIVHPEKQEDEKKVEPGRQGAGNENEEGGEVGENNVAGSDEAEGSETRSEVDAITEETGEVSDGQLVEERQP